MTKYYFYTRLVECETYSDFENMISVGNCRFLCSYHIDKYYDVVNYSKTFKGFNWEEFYYPGDDPAEFLYQVIPTTLVGFLDPKFDAKTKTVTFFENLDKRDRGVRSNPTKMGKFFRKIAPFFNDKQIEFLVNYTVSYFEESNYTHNIATDTKITEIYLSKAERGRYLATYSCINASCMRHNDWSVHPTKVYATESWELHYLTNEDGDIAARALVCKEDNAYSYIYASCEHSGDILKEKLEELGFTDCDKVYKAFEGAKLLKIEGNGGLVAPYIDYHCDVKDCGDHLEITYGFLDYCFNETGGYIEVNHSCEECGCEYHEEDMVSIGGYLYCENCTFFCEHFEEYMVGESYEVFYSMYGSYTVCENALNDMGAVYNEEENEWQTAEWFAECTKEDEEDSEDEIQPKKKITPGVDCVVISGYESKHHFPIGTVVKVMSKFSEGMWDCHSFELCFSQNIETKDLVVTE